MSLLERFYFIACVVSHIEHNSLITHSQWMRCGAQLGQDGDKTTSDNGSGYAGMLSKACMVAILLHYHPRRCSKYSRLLYGEEATFLPLVGDFLSHT